MPPVAAPVWWEDVQQEREDLAGRSRRPVDEWLDEDVDFAPRRRLPRRSADAAVVLELELGGQPQIEPDLDEEHGAATVHPLHGRFVHAESVGGGGVAAPRRSAARPAAGLEPELEPASATGTLNDARFLSPPPPEGERRIVHITGRPEQARAPLPSRRHRPRTMADRIGPSPDKLALYAFVLGIILVLIALSSASPS